MKRFLNILLSLAMATGTTTTYGAPTTPISPVAPITPPMPQNGSQGVQNGHSSPVKTNSLPMPNIYQMAQAEDPTWEEFQKASQEATDFEMPIDKNDPALDKDPFFLRSQKWQTPVLSSSNSFDESKGLQFKKGNGGLQLQATNSPLILSLELPLTPFAITDDYVFLSADEGSALFADAAGPHEKPGEGLFFIPLAELKQRAHAQQPVPVFFFPLPGNGWTGTILSHEIENVDILAIANKVGTTIALELADVETVMKAQQINLLLATATTLAFNDQIKDLENKTPILPAPKTTAGFGMFFTGMSKDLYGQRQGTTNSGFLADLSEWLQKGLESPLGKALNKHHLFTSIIQALSPAQAHAFSLPPDVAARLIFVGSVLTGMLMLSVVLKYAHPGIRGKLKALRDPKNEPKKLSDKLLREAREALDVFAHVTTTSAQFVSVTFANSLELFLDRFAPSVAAAEHTLVRRFLNNSLYFARNSVMKSPVNARTFFLGAIVMGSVDTAFVAVQYFIVVPWLCRAASPFLNDEWRAKVDQVFDPNNPNTRTIAITDTVRNGVSYLQRGASSYSMESRAQVIEGVTSEVEAYMRATGKDPKNPINQALRQKLIEEKTDLALQQRGLPGQDRFLFDANSLFDLIPKSLGHQVPENLLGHESFILAKRFGLTKAALKKAMDIARQQAKIHADSPSLEALALLQETSDKMSFLANGVRQGVNGIREARRVRQQLTLLSFEGPIEWGIKYLPESWVRRTSPESAQAAALYFRQALYSLLDKQGDQVFQIAPQELYHFGEEAIRIVSKEMQAEDPDLVALEFTEAKKALQNNRGLEFYLRTQMKINEMARKAEALATAQNYKPKKGDWLKRRKLKKAEKAANERLGNYVDEAALIDGGKKLSATDVKKLKRQFYRDALAKEVGLHLYQPDDPNLPAGVDKERYSEMLIDVEKRAVEITLGEIQHDLGLKSYLEKIHPFERTKIETALYATNFLSAYKEASTDREMIAPTDPMQPGAFQFLRQKSWVGTNPILNRSIRVLESLGDDQALLLGWDGFFRRNLPLFHDLWSTHRRLFKTALTDLTIVYLWNYYVWQLHMPYSAWTIFLATAAAGIMTPSQWLNRVFRMNGVKSMGGVLEKIAFAVPFAWVTFLGMIPMTLLSPEAQIFFAESIRDPFFSFISQFSPEQWKQAALASGLVGLGLKGFMSAKEALELRQFEKKMKQKLDDKNNRSSSSGNKDIQHIVAPAAPSVPLCIQALNKRYL